MKIKKTIRKTFVENIPFLFSTPAVLWQVLFLYIPLVLVLFASFRSVSSIGWFGFSFEHYVKIFDFSYLHIIARSALMASSVAFFCLICAYPVAYYLAVKVSRRWKNVLLFLLTLPFWTNFLIQVYSWVFVLDHNGLINTMLLKIGIIQQPLHIANNMYAIFFVMLHYYLPFMIMPLYSILEKIQHDLFEASMDLGATHWQTFTHVTFPLSLSGIKTGVMLVLVPAFGEFVIPAIIGGSKQMMVGSLVSHYFLVARDNQLGAAFTMISGIVLLSCALFFNWLCTTKYNTMQGEQS